MALRLIPQYKKLVLRPISVGLILRRISGKVVMMLLKNDIIYVKDALQLSVGQDAGVEAVVHTVHDIFPMKILKSFY